MHSVVICIGSNVPECRSEMDAAISWLLTSVIDAGGNHTLPYATVPEGNDAGAYPYLNAVMTGRTNLTCAELQNMFKRYEQTRGRNASDKGSKQIIIDIDLVCYDNEILRPADFNATYFRTGYRKLM